LRKMRGSPAFWLFRSPDVPITRSDKPRGAESLRLNMSS
jgi:hypothetical protein